jgi:hypothetical protein
MSLIEAALGEALQKSCASTCTQNRSTITWPITASVSADAVDELQAWLVALQSEGRGVMHDEIGLHASLQQFCLYLFHDQDLDLPFTA